MYLQPIFDSPDIVR